MKNISFRSDVLPLKNILYRLALRITLSREDAERIRTFIYQWKYVFRRPLDVAYEFLCAVDSPMRGRFWEAVHDLNLSLLEATLERQGLPALSRP